MSIEKHDYLIQLEPNATLWRYINLNKFYSLLDLKSMFFCRADKFSDPFEGTLPRKENEFRPIKFEQACNFYNIPMTKEKFERMKSSEVDFVKRSRLGTVINCWQINSYESDAMWRLYLKSNEGVAIQTNPERLYSSFENTKEAIYPSKVRYIDYDNDIFYNEAEYPFSTDNSLIPFIHKRIEFSSENEFRLFHKVEEAIFHQSENYWNTKENKTGLFINVCVETLIERIYFPPTLEYSMKEEITNYAKMKGYSFDFQSSKLQQNPYF